MSSVVLDASAGVEIALRTLPGRRFEKRLADHRVFVPEIFYSEVAGVLRRKTARDEIAVQRAAEALRRLLSLRTSRASVTPLIIQAWELRQNLVLADALLSSTSDRR